MPVFEPIKGGPLYVQGPSELSAPIAWPAQKPFAVEGRTTDGHPDPSAALLCTWTDKRYALDIAPKQPAADDGTYVDLLQRLACVRVQGKPVRIVGGGKALEVEQFRVCGARREDAPRAFEVRDHDGGKISCNIHENFTGGVGFFNSHCLDINITSRDNNDVGWYAEDCGAINGRLYTESNGQYNQSWNRSARSRLSGSWQENAWWQGNVNPLYKPWVKYPPRACHGLRRNCFDLDLGGQMQADSNQAWDDDPVSFLFCPAPRVLGTEFLPYRVGGGLEATPYGWPAGSVDIAYAPAGINTITVHKSAFENLAGAQPTIEFADVNGGMANAVFNTGDALVVEFSVSSPDWAFLGNQLRPALRWSGMADQWKGTDRPLNQSYYITRPNQHYSYTWPAFFPVSGKGPRLFLDIGPLYGSGPAQDYTLAVGVNAYVIPGAWK